MKIKNKFFILFLCLFVFWMFHFKSKEVSYSSLENYLSKKEWEKADSETSKIMKKILLSAVDEKSFFGYSRFDFFDQSKFTLIAKKRISCKYFQNLDKVWMKYSKGQYGFSPQSEIYQKLERQNNFSESYTSFKYFKEEIGWNYSVDNPTERAYFYDSKNHERYRGYFPSYIWIKENIKIKISDKLLVSILMPSFLKNYQSCVENVSKK